MKKGAYSYLTKPFDARASTANRAGGKTADYPLKTAG
jgi:hypothetical protein